MGERSFVPDCIFIKSESILEKKINTIPISLLSISIKFIHEIHKLLFPKLYQSTIMDIILREYLLLPYTKFIEYEVCSIVCSNNK